MGVLILAIIGGLIGYIACLTIGRGEKDMLINVVVGMLGALLAALLLSPYFGMPKMLGGEIALVSLFVSLIGSVVLVGLLNFSIVKKKQASNKERKSAY